MATTEPLIGGQYRIVKKLAETVIGTFYQIRHIMSGKLYIAKAYKKEGAGAGYKKAQLELEEIKRFQKIRHANLVTVLDLLEDQGRHFAIFQPIEGIPIEDFLFTHSSFPPQERMLNIGVTLLNLLAFLHKQTPPVCLGVISPSRVFLTNSGPKVFQFELDAVYGKTPKFTEKAFCAPENRDQPQNSDEYKIAADLYSLSALLYYLLCKEVPVTPPYQFPSTFKNPYVSKNIEALILQCLSPQPEKRLQSALDFKKQLMQPESVSGGEEVSEEPTFLGLLLEHTDNLLVKLRFTWRRAPAYFIISFITVFILILSFYTFKAHKAAIVMKAPLICTTSGNVLSAINTMTGKLVYSVELPSSITHLFYLPSENRMAVILKRPPKLYLISPHDGKIMTELPLKSTPDYISYDLSTEHLFFTTQGSRKIETIMPGVSSSSSSAELIGPSFSLNEDAELITVDRSGTILYAANKAKKLFLVDLITGKAFKSIALEGVPVSLISAVNRRVVVMEDDPSGFSVISGHDGKVMAHHKLPFLGIKSGTATNNGDTIFLWDPKQPKLAIVTDLIKPQFQIIQLSFFPQQLFIAEDRQQLYISDNNGNIHIIQLVDYEEKGLFQAGTRLTGFFIYRNR